MCAIAKLLVCMFYKDYTGSRALYE